MSRKRLIIIFLSVLALVIIITGADMFLKSNQEKQKATKIADDYLVEHNLTENVQTKETVYDSKTAEYYIEITFKDEPKNSYEFITLGNKIYHIIAYDESNVEIIDSGKAKYLKDD